MSFLIYSTDFSDCQEALGMENGKITNNEISASSVYNSNTGASRARLNFIPSGGVSGGWVAAVEDDKPTLTITFSYPFTRLTGIATQGRQDVSQWVKTYRLRYSKPNGEKGEAFDKVNNNLMGRFSLHTSHVTHQIGAYPGSVAWSRKSVSAFPGGWVSNPPQGYPQQPFRHLCLSQEHNAMSPARARARTALSGVEHTNHETTAPPLIRIHHFCVKQGIEAKQCNECTIVE